MFDESKMGENIIEPEELVRERKIEELKARIININFKLTEVSEEINSCPAKIVKSSFNLLSEDERIDKERLDILRKQREELEEERKKYSKELENL